MSGLIGKGDEEEESFGPPSSLPFGSSSSSSSFGPPSSSSSLFSSSSPSFGSSSSSSSSSPSSASSSLFSSSSPPSFGPKFAAETEHATNLNNNVCTIPVKELLFNYTDAHRLVIIIREMYDDTKDFTKLNQVFITIVENQGFTLDQLFKYITGLHSGDKCYEWLKMFVIIYHTHTLLRLLKQFITPLDLNAFDKAKYNEYITKQTDQINSSIDTEIQKTNAILLQLETLIESGSTPSNYDSRKKKYEKKKESLESSKTEAESNLKKNIKNLIDVMINYSDGPALTDNLIKIMMGTEDGQNELHILLFGTLKKSKYNVRDLLENLSAVRQCDLAIGRLEDLVSTGVCYICNVNLDITDPKGDRHPSQCEHIMPIFSATKHLCLVSQAITEVDKPKYEYEYKWTHACCNLVKNAYEFIKYDNIKNKFDFDDNAIQTVLNLIRDKLNLDGESSDNIADNCFKHPMRRDLKQDISISLTNIDEAIANVKYNIKATLDRVNTIYDNLRECAIEISNHEEDGGEGKGSSTHLSKKDDNDLKSALILRRVLSYIHPEMFTKYNDNLLISGNSASDITCEEVISIVSKKILDGMNIKTKWLDVSLLTPISISTKVTANALNKLLNILDKGNISTQANIYVIAFVLNYIFKFIFWNCIIIQRTTSGIKSQQTRSENPDDAQKWLSDFDGKSDVDSSAINIIYKIFNIDNTSKKEPTINEKDFQSFIFDIYKFFIDKNYINYSNLCNAFIENINNSIESDDGENGCNEDKSYGAFALKIQTNPQEITDIYKKLYSVFISHIRDTTSKKTPIAVRESTRIKENSFKFDHTIAILMTNLGSISSSSSSTSSPSLALSSSSSTSSPSFALSPSLALSSSSSSLSPSLALSLWPPPPPSFGGQKGGSADEIALQKLIDNAWELFEQRVNSLDPKNDEDKQILELMKYIPSHTIKCLVYNNEDEDRTIIGEVDIPKIALPITSHELNNRDFFTRIITLLKAKNKFLQIIKNPKSSSLKDKIMDNILKRTRRHLSLGVTVGVMQKVDRFAKNMRGVLKNPGGTEMVTTESELGPTSLIGPYAPVTPSAVPPPPPLFKSGPYAPVTPSAVPPPPFKSGPHAQVTPLEGLPQRPLLKRVGKREPSGRDEMPDKRPNMAEAPQAAIPMEAESSNSNYGGFGGKRRKNITRTRKNKNNKTHKHNKKRKVKQNTKRHKKRQTKRRNK